MCKESERYSSPAAQLTDRAIGLAIALRVVSGADASVAPKCNSASTDRPVSMVTMISALTIRACGEISASTAAWRNSVSWPAQAGHPRLFLCATQQSRGWPACAGHDTGDYDAASVDSVVSPRALSGPYPLWRDRRGLTCHPVEPRRANHPLDQKFICSVRRASVRARQAGAVVAAAAQARTRRKWTQKTQMDRRPARIGGSSVG